MKKYTTLSVDTGLRKQLEDVMIKSGKKMTYNDTIQYLIDFYNESEEEDDFVKRMVDGDMIDDGPESFSF